MNVEDEIEIKNLIEAIIQKLKALFNLEPVRETVNAFVSTKYMEGIEEIGIKFNMNFVPKNDDVAFLNHYVFDNLA